MSDQQLISLYKQLEYILHLYDGWIYQDLLRKIGEWLIFGLAWLNNFIERNINKVITLNDFYASEPIQNFMESTRPIIWGLFLLALVILGIQFMLNKIEKRNEIILNIILALSIVVIIPDLVVNMGKITNAGLSFLNDNSETLAGDLIKSNVADVLYYAENDFRFGQIPRPMDVNDSSIGTTDFTNANRLNSDTLRYISFTEKIDLQDDDGWIVREDYVNRLSDDAKKVLKNKLVATGDGNFVIQELNKNQVPMTKLGQESYYRYHVNWLVLILSLIVTTVALAITVIKIGRSVFDLAFYQIFGMFIAATDLTGGQRTKKILVVTMNTFAVIFIMMMLLKLFIFYTIWANGLKSSVGSVVVLLLLIAGAWALIDAPDIVQQMMGVDAGLRSGYQSLMGAYAGSKLIGSGAKALGKLGLAGAAVGAGATNFGRRAISGMFTQTPSELSNSSRLPSINDWNDPLQNNTNETTYPTHEKDMSTIPESTNVSSHKGDTPKMASSHASSPNNHSQIKGNERTIQSGGHKGLIDTNAPKMESRQNRSSIGASNSTKNSIANDGSILKYGHKEAKHTNTWLGGNRHVRQAKEYLTRAGNSGFDFGQNIRKGVRAGARVSSKGLIHATRAVIHPKKNVQNVARNIKTGVGNGKDSIVQNSEHMKNQIGNKMVDVVNEIKRPLGERNDDE